MYHRYYRLKQALFPKRVDSTVFFPGGGRAKVLQHILDALGKGMPLLHLSGAEGAGKTHLCHLIRQKIHFTHTVVLLSESSGDFDEIGRNIASALGERDVNHLSGMALNQQLHSLISGLAEKGGTILIIIDDVEKLSSKVLKFVLRLARDTEPKGGVQFVLAGKLALGANPELFSAILAEPLEQFTYTLQPLDRDATSGYLAHRLAAAGIPDQRENEVFSEEAVARIHRLSCGNIQRINELADDALRHASREQSLTVLQNHVGASPGSGKNSFERLHSAWQSIKLSKLKYTAVAVLAVAFAAITFIVNEPDGSNIGDTKDATDKSVLISSAMEEHNNIKAVEKGLKEKNGVKKKQPDPEEPPQKIESRQEGSALSGKHEAASLKSDEMVKPVVITLEKDKTKRFAGGTILEKRKQATSSWKSRALRDRYTIQILMLRSKTAEKELSQILDNDAYRNVQDNLYVLEKNSRPTQIFLYYGAYMTAQEARQARDRLPEDLKKYTPFPLSIAAAIKKSRR